MKKRLIFAITIALLFYSIKAVSQKSTAVLPLTADSLSSGNSKDVFRSFFQLAINRIISNNKEIQFSSNPYAIMTKIDSSLLKSSNYLKYTGLRRLNFSFSVKLDSSYKFNGFSSGIKYAIINKRDETVSDQFVKVALDLGTKFFDLNRALGAYTSKFPTDRDRQIKLNNQYQDFRAGKISFDKLDVGLQKVFRVEARRQAEKFNGDTTALLDANLSEVINKTYSDLRTKFRQRGLWTVGVSDTTYKDQFFFSNILLSTEYLKGLGSSLKPVGVEFNSKATYNFVDDSLKIGKDLHRQVFQVEPGLNVVFRTKNLYSFAEFKISGSYYHIFSGLNAKENRDSVTLNGTLRLRIINDIWIPLEIKYDPRSGNVFGFLNVRANFSGLKDLFSSDKSQNSSKRS